jgi:hypothetical protein
MYLRLAQNSQSSCLSLLSAGIIDMLNHGLYSFKGDNEDLQQTKGTDVWQSKNYEENKFLWMVTPVILNLYTMDRLQGAQEPLKICW